ncbi:DUF2508 family protein [Clostridium niameyense]|nr:DUF2508 family protein [Clostridium niameyense]
MIKKSKTKEKEILLNSIENVVDEIKNIRILFENANDPKLIDYAIYTEEALKAKYMYLLSQAKQKGIKVQYEDIVKEVEVV